jgi:predicted flap endonuclease-1-like 5' DNA nuclease
LRGRCHAGDYTTKGFDFYTELTYSNVINYFSQEAFMLAMQVLAASAEQPDLGWLVWVVLIVFVLMVFLGWLVWSKGWLKQEEEVPHDSHVHAEHEHEPAPAQAAAPDDLTTLEGIGPKVAKLLTDNGIPTFAALAEADLGKLRELLAGAGYQYMEPAGWVDQAKLAAAGETEALQKLQDELKGGRYTG